jgi:H+/gluconate symporter-like permease
MAQAMFKAADIPRHLMPAAIVLGTSTFTMNALPGTPAIQNAIPMPFFGTTPFAAPGLGIIASVIMFSFGMWWLGLAKRTARRAQEGFGDSADDAFERAVDDPIVRERATVAQDFDPAKTRHGQQNTAELSSWIAALPLGVVVLVNLVMSLFVISRWNAGFLGLNYWGNTSLVAVGGVWSVLVALIVAILFLIALNYKRLSSLRNSMDAGANAAVLPVLSVASLVGFGSVIAALPAFELVRDWVLSIEGGPLVSLAFATNVLSALTGSASGGLTIALQALGSTYLELATALGIDPALMHRVAVIGAGTLDSLPHNGAVVTLLAVCGATHGKSYRDIVIVGIIGPIIALTVLIALVSVLGSF